MATVLIRNIDDGVIAALKIRARRSHRSLEAELRSILEEEVREHPASAAEQAPAYGDEPGVSPAIRYPDPDAPPFTAYDPIPVNGPRNAFSEQLLRDRHERW